jgi:glycine/sarcosine N-methyltransferase
MSTAQFYDGLADTYHALYPDWRNAGMAQAEALRRLLSRWHRGPADIADVACGIGTQLIGLASLGHRVTGSDISARAVSRARRECAAAGVRADLLVADMRDLPLRDSCADAVICADNALPHLLSDNDALAALAQMSRVLRPGGTAIVTIRDYDRILADPPASTVPQVFRSDGTRVISFQLWDWHDNAGTYDLEHFQVHERGSSASPPATGTATSAVLARSTAPTPGTTSGLWRSFSPRLSALDAWTDAWYDAWAGHLRLSRRGPLPAAGRPRLGRGDGNRPGGAAGFIRRMIGPSSSATAAALSRSPASRALQ